VYLIGSHGSDFYPEHGYARLGETFDIFLQTTLPDS
jgi:hypothetical protein